MKSENTSSENEKQDPNADAGKQKKGSLLGKHPAIVAFVLVGILIAGSIVYAANVLRNRLSALQTIALTSNTGQQTPQTAASGVGTGTIQYPVNIKLPANAPMLGNQNAPVTVVEYGDFQCPYCGELYRQDFATLQKQYIDTGKVKFYFQNFAFLGPESERAAVAAECANEQGKFWQFYGYLYSNQKGENHGQFSDPNLETFAKNLGLTMAMFTPCFKSSATQAMVTAETKAGQSYGVASTPTIFVNGTPITGLATLFDYSAAFDDAAQAIIGK